MVNVSLTPAVREALRQFRAVLDERFGARIEAVKLFGSHARGEAGEESDVDVLVLLRDASRAEVDEITVLATDAGFVGDTYVVLSPFVRTPQAFAELLRRELRIARDIEREGIPL